MKNDVDVFFESYHIDRNVSRVVQSLPVLIKKLS